MSTPVTKIWDGVLFAPIVGIVDSKRAVDIMRTGAIRRLPVLDDGKPVGMVSLGDLAMELDRTSAPQLMLFHDVCQVLHVSLLFLAPILSVD